MNSRSALVALGSAGLLLVASTAAATVAHADDLPPGAPPGVCPVDTGYGPPLSSATTTAARLVGGQAFLEGPVWVAEPGYLLMSDMAAATGPQRVQPSTMVRYTPGAAAVETAIADSGSNGLALSPTASRSSRPRTTSAASPAISSPTSPVRSWPPISSVRRSTRRTT